MTIEELQKELARAEDEQRRLAEYVAALRRALELHPLTTRDHSARIGHTMEGQTETRQRPAGRRGPTIKSDGPFAIASDNSGLSIRQIAKNIGITYSAAKMADARKRSRKEVRAALAPAPYLVPESAWKTE